MHIIIIIIIIIIKNNNNDNNNNNNNNNDNNKNNNNKMLSHKNRNKQMQVYTIQQHLKLEKPVKLVKHVVRSLGRNLQKTVDLVTNSLLHQ